MTTIEEANRLLGKALGELTEWRKAWVLDKTHIDASEKYILSVLALLDNMEEENVENYEIAYRQGWQAAKASSLKEPPAKEPLPRTDQSGTWENDLAQIIWRKQHGDKPMPDPRPPAEEPVKCCKCSRKMDDPEGWVEGLNNHMWCPGCQPPEEPEKVAKWNTYYDAASKKSYTCSRCNAPEDYETRFCPNCGASMEEIVEELMWCPECGNSMEALSGGGRCKATNEWLCTEGHGVWWECAKCGSVDPRHTNPIDNSRLTGPGGFLDKAWWRITAEEERRKKAEERKKDLEKKVE